MTTQANHAGVAKLWLLNLVGNAAALAAWYFWLLLPDAHGWQVAGSGLLAVIVIFFRWCGCVPERSPTSELQSFANTRPSGARSVTRRHIVALALWAVLVSGGRVVLSLAAPVSRRSSASGSGRSCHASCVLAAPVKSSHAADWLFCCCFG